MKEVKCPSAPHVTLLLFPPHRQGTKTTNRTEGWKISFGGGGRRPFSFPCLFVRSFRSLSVGGSVGQGSGGRQSSYRDLGEGNSTIMITCM